MRFLLLTGRPLREPIARYGPFVMNTSEEIIQAIRDYQRGTFLGKRALLGHTRLDTTQVYASIRPPQLKRAVAFYEEKAIEILTK